MITITIYGNAASYSYEYAKTIFKKLLDKYGLIYQIKEINQPEQYNINIQLTPAFEIENQVLYYNDRGLDSFSNALEKLLINLKQQNMQQNIKEIIVPIDYSTTADNALEYAKGLAKYLGTSIRLLHVYAPSVIEMNETTFVVQELEVIQRDSFAKYVHQLEARWKDEINDTFKLTSEFRFGFAGDEIINISEDTPNAMIVMGSRGEGSSKNLFGSVSTRVAQKSKIPVLVIPPGASFYPIESIAYCSHDESLDSAVLNKIINIAKPFDATINLIHAGWTDNYSGINILDVWRQHYPKSKISLERVGKEGSVEDINTYCRENEIDLLAMSTRERGFLNDLFHRSFTKQMAIHTKIPLLVTHSVKSEISV